MNAAEAIKQKTLNTQNTTATGTATNILKKTGRGHERTQGKTPITRNTSQCDTDPKVKLTRFDS